MTNQSIFPLNEITKRNLEARATVSTFKKLIKEHGESSALHLIAMGNMNYSFFEETLKQDIDNEEFTEDDLLNAIACYEDHPSVIYGYLIENNNLSKAQFKNYWSILERAFNQNKLKQEELDEIKNIYKTPRNIY